jgi:hypothetical protein
MVSGTVIVTALAAGAVAGPEDSASKMVQDSYKHEFKPEAWREALKEELRESGAADDPEIIRVAQVLLPLVNGPGAQGGKHAITVKGRGQVGIVGHHAPSAWCRTMHIAALLRPSRRA